MGRPAALLCLLLAVGTVRAGADRPLRAPADVPPARPCPDPWGQFPSLAACRRAESLARAEIARLYAELTLYGVHQECEGGTPRLACWGGGWNARRALARHRAASLAADCWRRAALIRRGRTPDLHAAALRGLVGDQAFDAGRLPLP